MKAAIRYYSRGGHVKAMAEALSRGTGVEAISVDEPGAEITEHLDLLFLGGALYNFALDRTFREYLESLPEGMIDEVVCFGSSWLTRRPIFLIQDVVKAKGIKINKQAVWSRNAPNDNLLEAIEFFGKNEMIRDRSLDGLPPYLVFKRSQEIKAAKEAAKAAGVEYKPELSEEDQEAIRRKEAQEAQAEAEAAEAAAREAEAAALKAAEEAAEAARIAREKAEAAAAAARAAEAPKEPEAVESDEDVAEADASAEE